MRAALLVLLFGAVVLAQDVTPVQFPPGTALRAALLGDIDADGHNDIVASTIGPDRALRVYLHRPKAKVRFGGEPDFLLAPVFKDVVAYAVADVHPDDGAEVVLFAAKGVWAWRPRAAAKERAVRLVGCSFLWQLPFHDGVPSWQAGVRDVDGDGLIDLVIPEPDGYRIAFQGPKGTFSRVSEVIVPADTYVKDEGGPMSVKARGRRMRTRFEVRFSLGETSVEASGSTDGTDAEAETAAPGPLLEISDAIPAPQLADFDGDGDTDLIVRTATRLFVWTQDKGAFRPEPAVNLEVPVVEDRARRLEVSYSAHITDLDKDRKADCVIFSGDQRSEDVRTQIQFFTQGQGKVLFKDGLPDQLLVLIGFAGNPRLADVNGDGYPDLMAGAFRPDLLDTIRAASNQTLDMELYLFLNRKGRFPRRPDIVHRASVEAKGLRFSRKQRLMAEFFGDATGDGILDLLVRAQADKITVLMTRQTRRGWQILEDPYFELSIHHRAGIQIGPPRGRRKAPDVLVLEPTQVLHVRFP